MNPRTLSLVLAAFVALGATPAPQGTPPTIYRTLVRPMCSKLQTHLMPAIAMILQNDRTIAKSQPLFDRYLTAGTATDPATHGDTTNYDAPGRTMALQRMEQLVTPLSQNVIAVQKILTDPSFEQTTGSADDDKHLAQAREELLKTLAMQSVSLDLINGFVQTEQLGDIQHSGEEYLGSINGGDLSPQQRQQMTPASANPAFQDPDTIGLPNNPYQIDPTQVPGLQVGYNKVSMVATGLQWVRGETASRENGVTSSVKTIYNECTAGQRAAVPGPVPTH